MNSKDVVLSRTFWAALLSYVTTLAATFGVHLNLAWWAPVLAGAATLVATLYGRAKATKSIASFFGLTTIGAAKKMAASEAGKSSTEAPQ